MYRVLICGDRNWTNREPIKREMKSLILQAGRPNKLLVIHGGARGADSIAGQVAQEMGVHTAQVDALWDSYHRGAGPTRNAVMLTLDPDEVVAFHANIDESRGTADMVKRAKKKGTPTKVRKK
jgi:hypothetical protein